MWSYVASEFTKPSVEEWQVQGNLRWCPDLHQRPILWNANNAFVI